MSPDPTDNANVAQPARPKQFGKYLLLEKIGSGGMAEIFKAVIRGAGDFQKVLVIKRILLAYSRDPTFVKMFVDEARITAPLQHANIVSIYEFDQVGGQYYLAMDFVNGRDLQRVMARANRLGRGIPTEVALHIVAEVCKALWYAYNARDAHGNPLRIIHRDISPSNILVSYDGEVKVTDFGVAKAANSTAKEASGSGGLKGKLGYMSPEQVLGRELDHRSDLFSLGIVLFECLTLKRLFLGRSDLQTLMNVRDADIEKRLDRHPEIPAPVAEILRKSLAKVPDKRYRSAPDFQTDIHDYLFEKGRRAGQESVAAFMRDLFAQEAEQEILPLEVEEVSEVHKSGFRPAAEVRAETARQDMEARKAAQEGEGASGAPLDVERPPPAAAQWSREPVIALEEVLPSEELGLPIDEGDGHAEPTRSTKVPLTGTEFRLRDSRGQVFGPVSFANLLGLLKSRAVTEDELCQVNDGEWVRVGGLAALQGKIEATPEVRKPPLMEGNIDRATLVNLVCDITRFKKLSGQLTLRHGSMQKEIHFKGGRPRFIVSNQRHELLGEYLIRRNLATPDQLRDALKRLREKQGAKIGDVLIASGLIQAHQLAVILQEQFLDRFLDIFRWEAGWYGFFEDTPAPKAAVSQDIDPIGALADAVRRVYAADLCRAYLSDHLQRKLTKVEHPRILENEFHLLPREQRVVTMIDSHNTINEIVAALPQTPEWQAIVYKTIFLLTQCQIYMFRGAGGRQIR